MNIEDRKVKKCGMQKILKISPDMKSKDNASQSHQTNSLNKTREEKIQMIGSIICIAGFYLNIC